MIFLQGLVDIGLMVFTYDFVKSCFYNNNDNGQILIIETSHAFSADELKTTQRKKYQSDCREFIYIFSTPLHGWYIADTA